LAQGNAMPLGQLRQPLAGAMHQLGVALARVLVIEPDMLLPTSRVRSSTLICARR
jgi:hypothetical protein